MQLQQNVNGFYHILDNNTFYKKKHNFHVSTLFPYSAYQSQYVRL